MALNITGIERDRYLINNPIWVEVSSLIEYAENSPRQTLFVEVQIIPNTFAVDNNEVINSLRLYPINNKIVFDISEAIKSFIPEPEHTKPAVNGDIIKNSIKVTIKFNQFTSLNDEFDPQPVKTGQEQKTFIRGGYEGFAENLSVTQNAILKDTQTIGKWLGYPLYIYQLNSNNQIVLNSFIDPSIVENRRELGCNPIYLRFLNNKGGYSYWLFEKWNYQKNTKSLGFIERRKNSLDLGESVDYIINVETRAEKRFNPLLKALTSSIEVHALNLFQSINQTIDLQADLNLWDRVYSEKNKYKETNFEEVDEFKFSFNTSNNFKPTAIW